MRTVKLGRKQESGFSMVEVLVAVLILAVGLLGVAGVQMRSLQQTTNAQVRTQVTLVAQDMAERMRLNQAVPDNATIVEFRDQLRAMLGDPNAEVAVNLNVNIATITIDWTERDAQGDAPSGDPAAPDAGSQQKSTFAMQVRI